MRCSSQLHILLFQLSKPNQTLLNVKQLHGFISKTHLSYDPFYATRIIRFYAINNDLVSAHNVFDEAPQRSVYLWNSIIRAYARANKFYGAMGLFKQMLFSETKPDNFTFACVVRSCCENFMVEGLRVVHGGVVVSGLGRDSVCCSALVTAYSRVGLIDYASRVFSVIREPDLVLWNSIISGYGCCRKWEEGLRMFSMMRNMGNQPDGYTLVGIITGMADPGLLRIGQGIHCFCFKTGVDCISHISSAIVSMYSRLMCMDSARRVFDTFYHPDLVTWSSLITGFSQCGDNKMALVFFRDMNMEGGKADPILIACALAASAQLAMVGAGSEIHGYAIRHGYASDIMVSAALIDMYPKCGFLGLGIRVFKNTPRRNVVSFNSLISSLGLYGLPSGAFDMFGELLQEGMKPDEYTFSALLCACSHAGLVNDGRYFFTRMTNEFKIIAKTDHYVHMVKLLGMAGELEEAYNLVQSAPVPVDSAIWGALLSCCDVHGNTEMADIVAQQLFGIEPGKDTYKVMLSNIYASDGRWNDAKQLRDNVIGGRQKKMPGLSWTEV
ncbi:Pentatricopeptide repeat-containing protein [Heracleum sosnowskyi]|uniref:Pentatricopeptide repeat-containing protein n=1 Tax=Heracleum sosnowskyi TaxID=360622 RepID=A0AAD8HBK0_9APIA|nr:Pentatricopeptide repeat-containing protein [Heracleum sosnowskyi]